MLRILNCSSPLQRVKRNNWKGKCNSMFLSLKPSWRQDLKKISSLRSRIKWKCFLPLLRKMKIRNPCLSFRLLYSTECIIYYNLSFLQTRTVPIQVSQHHILTSVLSTVSFESSRDSLRNKISTERKSYSFPSLASNGIKY